MHHAVEELPLQNTEQGPSDPHAVKRTTGRGRKAATRRRAVQDTSQSAEEPVLAAEPEVVSSEAAEQNAAEITQSEPSIFFSPATQDVRNIDSPMEIIPEDRGQHAHSLRLEDIITTSVLDASMDGRSTHTDADEGIFNIPSTRRMEVWVY